MIFASIFLHNFFVVVVMIPNIYDCSLFILQVKTQLEHPTKYHIQQKQNQQIQLFLHEKQAAGTTCTTGNPQSMPNMVAVQGGSNSNDHTDVLHTSSAPLTEADSPLQLPLTNPPPAEVNFKNFFNIFKFLLKYLLQTAIFPAIIIHTAIIIRTCDFTQ